MTKFKYIAAAGTAFILSIIGLTVYLIRPSQVVLLVLAALSVLSAVPLIVGAILAQLRIRKINQAKVADMQGYLLRHRKEAAETSFKLLKKLQRLRRATTLYAILIWLLAASAALLSGILLTYRLVWLYYPVILYAAVIFGVIYTRIPGKDPVTLDEDTLVLNHDAYPCIHSVANRAAQTMGCQGELTIILSSSCNAGITRVRNQYYLYLGVVLLSLLSEEELYCICLHEFSHCTEEHQDSDHEARYSGWLSSGRHILSHVPFANNLFHTWDIDYLFTHMTYQYATSVVKEMDADRAMAKYSSPEVAGSALLKINYETLFQWESGVYNEPSEYVDENPNPRYLSEYTERIKNAIEIRHKDWNAMLAKEILPNNASHPTLKMRLETLGVQRIETVADGSNAAYRGEVQKAIVLADQKLAELKEHYEQCRKENYLEPMARLKAWEAQGEPILAEQYADIISDLKQVGRHEDAEALCDRAIQTLDVHSSIHAYFIKGCTMLHRYDSNGVDYIYHAIEYNYNYLEEGLNELGSFYCMMGMEEELLRYRERAQQFMQKNKDEYSETAFLSPKDTLSRDDMPDSMREEILAYIRSIDENIIENIYLVRKTVNETFFFSAFVIHFYGGTDEQRNGIMHKIFRYLDSYPVKWQFSLFDYFECPNIKFNKIEGSLVYSKSNGKGEKQ